MSFNINDIGLYGSEDMKILADAMEKKYGSQNVPTTSIQPNASPKSNNFAIVILLAGIFGVLAYMAFRK